MENISVVLHRSLQSAAVRLHLKVRGMLNKDHVASSGTHTVDGTVELKSPGGAAAQRDPGNHSIASERDIHCWY